MDFGHWTQNPPALRAMPFTTQDLAAIDTAIATGELSVRTSDGKQITYRTMGELLQAKQAIQAEIRSTTQQQQPRAIGPRHVLADFSD